eukprot:3446726-Pleurochrysis_carterae.AAC.1
MEMTSIGLAAWRRKWRIKKKADRRRLRPCDGAAHGGVNAHVDVVAVVGPCSMCARRRRDDAKEVRSSVIRRRSKIVVEISSHSVHLSLAGRIGGVVVAVAVIVLGEDVEGRVEAEQVAIVIGAEHEGLLVARRPLVLLIAMSAGKGRTRAAGAAAQLQEAHVLNAVAWTARLDSRRANGLATL